MIQVEQFDFKTRRGRRDYYPWALEPGQGFFVPNAGRNFLPTVYRAGRRHGIRLCTTRAEREGVPGIVVFRPLDENAAQENKPAAPANG